ncbi:ribonuclease III [bacterium]|nr:ribonuclease III [bacterium]
MKPNSSLTGKRRKNRSRGALSPPALERGAREAVEAAIGRRFSDPAGLDRAMTHRSSAAGRPADWSNERLEFLGDRVLGLVVAEALFQRHEGEREGKLALRLNALVNRDVCARVGRAVGLETYVLVDPAERSPEGELKASILADVTEAVIGAVYLDGGYQAARTFVLKAWKAEFAALGRQPAKDPKSELQEWAQAAGKPTPVYAILRRSGPDHAPVFDVEVQVDGLATVSGLGATKQDAERAAARALLDHVAALEVRG